jgi:hypothetical protein
MTVNNGNASAGLERMLRLGSSWDIEFFEPIRVDTEFQTSTSIIGAELLERRRGGRMIKQTAETYYRDDKGHLLAKGLSDCFRLPMKGSGSAGYAPRHAEYTLEELADIERGILSEEHRGASKRLLQSVGVGDSLGLVVKGPLTSADFACWYAAYNMVSHSGWPLESRVRRERVGQRDMRLQHALKSHDDLAGQVGMPGVWMGGPAVLSWIVHLLTNWQGDDGFLKRLQVEVRRPVVLHDTTWCTGTVSAVAKDQVECAVEARNQIGERVVNGQAWINLPTE